MATDGNFANQPGAVKATPIFRLRRPSLIKKTFSIFFHCAQMS